jgi:hypothetical protein
MNYKTRRIVTIAVLLGLLVLIAVNAL